MSCHLVPVHLSTATRIPICLMVKIQVEFHVGYACTSHKTHFRCRIYCECTQHTMNTQTSCHANDFERISQSVQSKSKFSHGWQMPTCKSNWYYRTHANPLSIWIATFTKFPNRRTIRQQWPLGTSFRVYSWCRLHFICCSNFQLIYAKFSARIAERMIQVPSTICVRLYDSTAGFIEAAVPQSTARVYVCLPNEI